MSQDQAVATNDNNRMRWVKMPSDPENIKQEAELILKRHNPGDAFKGNEAIVLTKALALTEFTSGVLLSAAVPDRQVSFAMKFSADLQKEYACQSESRKSLAEVVALNYCRILELQARINSVLGWNKITPLGTSFITTLSKELDRAQRHYLTALQILEVGMQKPIKLNVNAMVANLANQQIVGMKGEINDAK